MTLSEFIENNMDRLIEQWEELARNVQPEDADLDREELRDWADGVLRAIAKEMETAQADDAPMRRRSKGLEPADAPGITEAAQVHAMHRLVQGFRISNMIAEYRSLRTTVSVMWHEETRGDPVGLKQLIRFDEALDHAVSESVRRYTTSLDRARDLFTAALGHDLRTPLASIRNTAEAFLLTPDQLSDEQVQGAVRIRNATERVLAILQDLLDFANTRLGGELPITRRETDVAALCADIIDELQAVHPESEVRVSCPSELTAAVDRDRIGQLLSNLVSNAIRYGRPRTPVTVAVTATDSEIRMRVHNEGEPIPNELRHLIFEPLRRGEGRVDSDEQPGRGDGEPRGLGLGLYIARQIAEAHGGRLDFDSSAEAGTTFEACIARCGK